MCVCVALHAQAPTGTCYLVTTASLPFRVLSSWIEKNRGARWSSVSTEEDRIACRDLCSGAHSSACSHLGVSVSSCVRVVQQATNTVEAIFENFAEHIAYLAGAMKGGDANWVWRSDRSSGLLLEGHGVPFLPEECSPDYSPAGVVTEMKVLSQA